MDIRKRRLRNKTNVCIQCESTQIAFQNAHLRVLTPPVVIILTPPHRTGQSGSFVVPSRRRRPRRVDCRMTHLHLDQRRMARRNAPRGATFDRIWKAVDTVSVIETDQKEIHSIRPSIGIRCGSADDQISGRCRSVDEQFSLLNKGTLKKVSVVFRDRK